MTAKTKAAVAIAAVVAIGVFVFAFSKCGAIELVYPFQKAKVSLSRRVLVRLGGMFNGASAAAENVRLKRNLAAVALENSEYERVVSENARLRKALGYMQQNKVKWIAAEVLSHGGGAADAYKSIRVGKGSLAGVRERAVVESPDGLVGIVSSVTPHTSEVMLITDPSVKVACKVDSPAPISGILSGGSDEFLLLRFVKAQEDVPPRAKVFTSGLGEVFPAGITVGTFCTGENISGGDAHGMERRAKVLPAVDFSALEEVFIRK